MARRNELFYGQSGTAKTESLIRVIRLMHSATGKKARVWVGDGSAISYEESGLVGSGVVELFSWENRPWPITTLNQAAEGMVPADVADLSSPFVPTPPKAMADIGLWAFEGASVAGLYILGDVKGGFAERAGRGEKIGQDSPIRIVDGEVDKLGNPIPGKGPAVSYGGNPLSHFMHAQKRMLGVFERSKALPGEFSIWTAHERAAEDKLSKETLIGPEVAGGALTANLQRIFGNTLHFVTAEKRVKVKDEFTGRVGDDLDVEYRIYTRDHISAATMVKYKAVTRGGLTAEEMPLYLVAERPGDAIEDYYGRLAAVKKAREAALKGAA